MTCNGTRANTIDLLRFFQAGHEVQMQFVYKATKMTVSREQYVHQTDVTKMTERYEEKKLTRMMQVSIHSSNLIWNKFIHFKQ